MKILNIASNDYACFSHDNANALRYVGVNCKDVTLCPHKFNYPSQSELVTRARMLELIPQYDIIQIMHSDPLLLQMVQSVDHNKIVVWHTGTRYRQNPNEMNDIFNPYVEMSFIALGEFSGLGSKNEVYSVGAIDTDRIIPTNPYKGGRIKIGHFPSNPIVKGTETIQRMMEDLTGDFEFICDTELVDYNAQLERMQSCDVIVELFAPEQDGKPYGSWGITALEAAAMGKVVVTQHLTENIYINAYGIKPRMELIHTDWLFKDMLQTFINCPKVTARLQKSSRNWVCDNHSYQATGERLRKMLVEL